MSDIDIHWNDFSAASGGAGESFCVVTAAPGAFADFASEFAALWAAYLASASERGLSRETELLLRFHLSDAANQGAPLREALAGRPASVVDQPPADRSRVALEAWHLKRRAGDPEIRMLYSPDLAGGDSCAQTRELFSDLEKKLAARGGNVADNVLRTWLYCRDVDNNYAGLVRGRNEYFDRIGLVERYIASTGIAGSAPERSQLVALDTLCGFGVAPEAIEYLHAEDHLSRTSLYGVRFERGMRLSLPGRDWSFISGTASIDSEGRVMHVGDFRNQCRRVLENLTALLAESGARLADIRSATIYLRDPADLETARREFTAELPVEAVYLRAPVCRPEWLIECECLAVSRRG